MKKNDTERIETSVEMLGTPLFRIGEMAELNHVSTQTLRLYDRNKLLVPQYTDPETGYRYYTLEQCARLDLIRALKSCRMPLEKIGEILSLSSQEELTEILEEQEKALDEEIYHLSVSRNNLMRIRKNHQLLQSLPPFGEVFLEHMAERRIDVQETGFDFFAQGYKGYEYMLRHMQHYLHENRLPPSYFINVGTLMEQAHFVRGEYASHAAFILVDELYPDTGNLHTLPQGMYMAVVSDDTALEPRYAGKLYENMQAMGLVPAGDYLCEVLSQLPMEAPGSLIYKIQVPVKKG